MVLLLLVAMLAIKTTSTTSATGQEACSKSYTACMDRCVARPSKTLQDNCMETCQTQSNACFSQKFGAPGPTAITVKEEPGKAALAADEASPAGKPAAKPAMTAKPTMAAKPALKPSERRPQ
jgi:hypothetical protein